MFQINFFRPFFLASLAKWFLAMNAGCDSVDGKGGITIVAFLTVRRKRERMLWHTKPLKKNTSCNEGRRFDSIVHIYF